MSAAYVVMLQSDAGRRLVYSKCKEAGLDPDVLVKLVTVQIAQQGNLTQHGIYEAFDEIFDATHAEVDD